MITLPYITQSGLPLPASVQASRVEPFIPRAVRELEAILPVELIAALEGFTDPQPWSVNNTYAAADRVTFRGKVYETLAGNTGVEPPAGDWFERKLGTFKMGHVLPWLAHHVFCAYAVNGGVNVTVQGLQEVSNETAANVSGTKLDAYLSYWQNERNALRAAMLQYLRDEDYTLDGVTYQRNEVQSKRPSFKIRPIDHHINSRPNAYES
jgi:hypothetical protein